MLSHAALLPIFRLSKREEGAYPKWSVTDKQRRGGERGAQPGGRECFGRSAALLAPYPAPLDEQKPWPRMWVKVSFGELPLFLQTLSCANV